MSRRSPSILGADGAAGGAFADSTAGALGAGGVFSQVQDGKKPRQERSANEALLVPLTRIVMMSSDARLRVP